MSKTLEKQIKKCEKKMNETDNYYEAWFWLKEYRKLIKDGYE